MARVPHSLEKDVDGDVMCSAPRNVVFFVDETEGDEDVISVAIGYSLLLAVVRSGKGGKGTLWAAVSLPPLKPAPDHKWKFHIETFHFVLHPPIAAVAGY